MYQERALYSEGEEKMEDLSSATELDPTLVFPYKYRTAVLMDAGKMHEAMSEINLLLGFKVTPDCLEMHAHISLDLEDYEGALRDIRAIHTLDPEYMLYSGKVSAQQLLCLLNEHVEKWSRADCWMQLYDRWSSVDDIGSLAVVHQMLDSEPGKGLLYFRQSLLLLRWVPVNCCNRYSCRMTLSL
jgi:tetratricopeptide (TPR) repeat protein